MPPVNVPTPGGKTITVDLPEGMDFKTPEGRAEAIRLAKQQHPFGMARTVDPETPGLAKPSVGEFVKKGVTERGGDIAATLASGVLPGGPLARTAYAELAGDVTQAALGQKVSPGYHAGANLVGEGIAKGAGALLSPIAYRKFATESAKKIGEWLKTNIPAARSFAADEKGLYDFAHKTGQRAISKDFDDALRKIGARAGSLEIEIFADDAARLGLKGGKATIQAPTASAGPAPTRDMVRVNAAEAINAVTGQWKKQPGAYRRVTDALDGELVKLNVPDYAQAREAYKLGAGFIEMAEKGKFLHGEKYDPFNAAKALDNYGKGLFRRGMDDLAGLIRGPGAERITKNTAPWWLRHVEGGLAGAAAGAPLGIPHAIGGAAGGIAAGSAIPRTTFKNVPLSPFGKYAEQIIPRGGRMLAAEGVREGARETGLPKALKGIETR